MNLKVIVVSRHMKVKIGLSEVMGMVSKGQMISKENVVGGELSGIS